MRPVLTPEVPIAVLARKARADHGRLVSITNMNGAIMVHRESEDREKTLSRLNVAVIGPRYRTLSGETETNGGMLAAARVLSGRGNEYTLAKRGASTDVRCK
jgi:hypothetical protein